MTVDYRFSLYYKILVALFVTLSEKEFYLATIYNFLINKSYLFLPNRQISPYRVAFRFSKNEMQTLMFIALLVIRKPRKLGPKLAITKGCCRQNAQQAKFRPTAITKLESYKDRYSAKLAGRSTIIIATLQSKR